MGIGRSISYKGIKPAYIAELLHDQQRYSPENLLIWYSLSGRNPKNIRLSRLKEKAVKLERQLKGYDIQYKGLSLEDLGASQSTS